MIENIKSLGSLNLENPTRWIFSFPLFERATVVLFTNLFLVRVSALKIFKNQIYVDNNQIWMDDYVEKNRILIPEQRMIGIFKPNVKEEIIEWNDFSHFTNNVKDFVVNEQPLVLQIFNTMVIELYARI